MKRSFSPAEVRRVDRELARHRRALVREGDWLTARILPHPRRPDRFGIAGDSLHTERRYNWTPRTLLGARMKIIHVMRGRAGMATRGFWATALVPPRPRRSALRGRS